MKDKINILGTEYSIELKEMGNSDYDGYCDYTSKCITVRSDNYNKVEAFDWLQKKQLRHEVIHAFMAESGLQANWEHKQEFGHDETTVDWFAIQIPKITKALVEAEIMSLEEIYNMQSTMYSCH
jgi:hypothetical protein